MCRTRPRHVRDMSLGEGWTCREHTAKEAESAASDLMAVAMRDVQTARSHQEELASAGSAAEQVAAEGASDAAAAAERAASLEAELQQTRSRLAEAERAAARAKAEAVAEVEASAGEVGAVRQAPALSCGAGGVHDMSTTCPTTTSLTRPHRSWRCRGTRRRSCERRSPPPSRRAPRSAHVSPETPAPAIVQRQ